MRKQFTILLVPAIFVCVATAPSNQLAQKGIPETYLLSCEGKHAEIKVRIVSLDKINSDRFIDLVGLRLYVTSVECQQRIRNRFSQPFVAEQFVMQPLHRTRAETGVEPATIPLHGGVGKELGTKGMVLIKGGDYTRPGIFYQSSDTEIAAEYKCDKYRVRVSPFYIDKYKVTNQQYCDFLNDGNPGYWTPWNPRIVRDKTPKFVPADPLLGDIHVVHVNWFQASGYAQWAGKRLATEAEWEYAAGGREGRKYPWGDAKPDASRVNFFKAKHHTNGDTLPAGATPEGVFDLVGNSSEWVSDYFSHGYYRVAPADGMLVNPKGPERGQPKSRYRRIFKGLCKNFDDTDGLRVLFRHSRPPFASSWGGIAIRCVKDEDNTN